MENTRIRRIVIYSRTALQTKVEKESIEIQERAMREKLGTDTELVQEYRDDGVSGLIPLEDRPAGKQLLCLARAHDIDELWIRDYCRLSRNVKELANILQQFQKWGIKICAICHYSN